MKSPRQAIKQHCLDCIYDKGAIGSGTKYEQTEGCTSYDCALYLHRPLSVSTRRERKEILDEITKHRP